MYTPEFALDSAQVYTTRPNESTRILHCFARGCAADSSISVLREKCQWKESLYPEMRHVPWRGYQGDRAVGQEKQSSHP
ncbi:hypothetical protein G6F32_017459 [Rhizopus arrhizus]|nr:hypothetical protein G6F32_017459 [Rhizopus arrhizus]